MTVKSLQTLIVFLFLFTGVFAQSDPDRIKGKKLYEKGMYSEAEDLFDQLAGKEKATGNRSGYAAAINGRAKVLTKKGKFIEADSLFREALRIKKEVDGDASLEYAETLNDLAEQLILTQKYQEAVELLEKAVHIRKKEQSKTGIDYARSLSNLGYCYLFTGKPEKAEQFLSEAAEIRRNTVGEKHPEYADSMLKYGNYFFFTEAYDSAEKCYLTLIEINRNALGESHPDYLAGLLCMSTLTGMRGKYKEAEQFILQALPGVEKNYGKYHPDYAGALSNLGCMYFKTREFDKAEPILKESLKISEQVLGKNHSYYFNAISSLGLLYNDSGQYEKAESLLIETLALRKELYGENNPSVTTALNNLALLYLEINNYEKAEYYYQEALKTTGLVPGKQSISYIFALNGLSMIYQKQGDYKKALTLMEEAAVGMKKTLGEDHPDYLSLLNNIANVQESDPNFNRKEIEKTLLHVLQKQKEILGEKHPDYNLTLNNLATFYYSLKDFEKAEKLLAEGVENLKDTPEETSRQYYIMLSNLADFYEASDKYKEARETHEKTFEIIKKQTEQNFSFLSENERELYWMAKKYNFNFFLSFSNKYKKDDPSTGAFAYDCELFSKSILLNSSQHVMQSITESKDTLLVDLWESVKSLKQILFDLENQLASNFGVSSTSQLKEALLTSGNDEYIQLWNDLAKMKEENIQNERFVLENSREYRQQQQEFSFRWKDIQAVLDENEAAVEFIHFDDIDIANLTTDKSIYCALILRPGYKYPEMISLCEEEELSDAISRSKHDSEFVYPLIWKPLENYLKDIKEVYIAPTGLLHSVSFAGMKKENGYIGDEYSVHNLLSTKDIIKSKNEESKDRTAGNAALFGGADYSLSGEELILSTIDPIDTDQKYVTRGILEKTSSTRGQGFDYLPGSEKEVKSIADQLSNLTWKTSLYIDKFATETRFKSLSGNSPKLLHVSTHGFYFPAPPADPEKLEKLLNSTASENIYRFYYNPLLRSGLAFTGANLIWNGKEVPTDTDDGILTAYEVSNLNLSGTELVVLSACETGLGDIAVGEGVYGLQRAFRLAGARSMIVSLWKVPDKETVELMTEFYDQWTKNNNKKNAFASARLKLRAKYPNDPEKWAGFVLIE